MKIDCDRVSGAICATICCSPFLSFGVWSIFFFKSLNILECQRLESDFVRCQLTAKSLLNSKTSQISALKKAELITDKSCDRQTYRVVLSGDRQKKFFSNVSKSNYYAKEAQVDRINSFINNPQQYTLTIEDDNRWYCYFIGSFVILICSVTIVCCCRKD